MILCNYFHFLTMPKFYFSYDYSRSLELISFFRSSLIIRRHHQILFYISPNLNPVQYVINFSNNIVYMNINIHYMEYSRFDFIINIMNYLLYINCNMVLQI